MFKKILLAIITIASINFSQTIHDLIQPINLSQDQPTIVMVGDLFYSEDYNVEFTPSKNVNASYNSSAMQLSLTPNNDFSGIELISFKHNGEVYQLPVKLVKSQKYLFTYKPQDGEKQVNLFGQFNSWDRQNLPMKDLNGDGVLEIEIPLDPGRYEYKFYVDGREVVDPANSDKVPNGMGDFNSLRIIEESAKDKMFLHVLGSNNANDGLKLNFYFENADRSNMVNKESLIALFDNKKFPSELMQINGREITLTVKGKMLKGNHTVRLAAVSYTHLGAALKSYKTSSTFSVIERILSTSTPPLYPAL